MHFEHMETICQGKTRLNHMQESERETVKMKQQSDSEGIQIYIMAKKVKFENVNRCKTGNENLKR